MISNNIIKFCFANFPLHTDQMIKSFIIFRSSRCLHRRQTTIDFHCNQAGIDHCIFAFARMYIKPSDFKLCLACIKILILDFSL